ncbi:conserved hypothetical protein [Ixodes scapularis]|uniref:E2F-associated phosphoprotein n=1 Tax=Ixodes scapularis TaxID=6945 RepID=B7P1J5_IXOSC|nr:conserved hypothetical protein [Ixodes scapularis]|eukprot:XP_002433403.1 conserved hypothetical protein [Ixodes scapularis]
MEYNDYHVEDSDDSDAYDSDSSSEDAFQSYVRNKYLSQNAPEETFEKQMQDELLQTFRDFEHRHEIYNTQYRAMFVKNCVVSDTEVLKCPPSRSKRKKNGGGADDPRDLFRPVRCRVCKTEVAVVDQDEVFHFFNVIASFS